MINASYNAKTSNTTRAKVFVISRRRGTKNCGNTPISWRPSPSGAASAPAGKCRTGTPRDFCGPRGPARSPATGASEHHASFYASPTRRGMILTTNPPNTTKLVVTSRSLLNTIRRREARWRGPRAAGRAMSRPRNRSQKVPRWRLCGGISTGRSLLVTDPARTMTLTPRPGKADT